jgi:hypothetical protein
MGQLKALLGSLFGDEAQLDPEAQVLQEALSDIYRDMDPHFLCIESAIERGSVAIKEIRYLSGVDGYLLETCKLEPLFESLRKRLLDRFPRFDERRLTRTWKSNASGTVQGNFYVLLHILELFCQGFLTKEQHIEEIHCLQSEEASLKVLIRGENPMSAANLMILERKLNFILKPFAHKVRLTMSPETVQMTYQPLDA